MDVLLQAGKQLVWLSFVALAINKSSPGTCGEGKNGIWQKNCDRDKDAMETSSKGCRRQGRDEEPIYPSLPCLGTSLSLPQFHRVREAGIRNLQLSTATERRRKKVAHAQGGKQNLVGKPARRWLSRKPDFGG